MKTLLPCLFILMFVFGCTNRELYFKDMNYCKDTLFLNKTRLPVNGKVYYLNESGKKSGYTTFSEGVPNGEFQEWGYDGQDIHTGRNIVMNIKDINPNLAKKYLRGFISEMKEGDFCINSLILIKNDSSEDIIDVAKTKMLFEKFISRNRKINCTKIDTVLFRIPKNEGCY